MTAMFHPERYVKSGSGKLEEKTGITDGAATQKRSKGVWRQGKEFVKGPDNNIYYDLLEIQKWMRGE